MLQLRRGAAAGHFSCSVSLPLVLLLLRQKENLGLRCGSVPFAPVPQHLQQHCAGGCSVSQEEQEQKGKADEPSVKRHATQQHGGHPQQPQRKPRGTQRQQKQQVAEASQSQQVAEASQSQQVAEASQSQQLAEASQPQQLTEASQLQQPAPPQRQQRLGVTQQPLCDYREPPQQPQQRSRREQEQQRVRRQQRQQQQLPSFVAAAGSHQQPVRRDKQHQQHSQRRQQQEVQRLPQLQQRAGAQQQGEKNMSSPEQHLRGGPDDDPQTQERRVGALHCAQRQLCSSTQLPQLRLPSSFGHAANALGNFFRNRESFSAAPKAAATPLPEAEAGAPSRRTQLTEAAGAIPPETAASPTPTADTAAASEGLAAGACMERSGCFCSLWGPHCRSLSAPSSRGFSYCQISSAFVLACWRTPCVCRRSASISSSFASSSSSVPCCGCFVTSTFSSASSICSFDTIDVAFSSSSSSSFSRQHRGLWCRSSAACCVSSFSSLPSTCSHFFPTSSSLLRCSSCSPALSFSTVAFSPSSSSCSSPCWWSFSPSCCCSSFSSWCRRCHCSAPFFPAFSSAFPSAAPSLSSSSLSCSSSSGEICRLRSAVPCLVVSATASSLTGSPTLLLLLRAPTRRSIITAPTGRRGAPGSPAVTCSDQRAAAAAAASPPSLWGGGDGSRRSLSFCCSKKVEKHLKLRTHPSNMGPSDIASLVRSAAAKDIVDGALWAAIKRRVIFLKPVLSPKALAQIANGFARMRKRDFEVFLGLAEQAAQHVDKFTAQETALFLNALARLDLRYDSLMQRFANRLVQDDADLVYEEQHLALIVNAYARLGAWKKVPALFVKLAERITRQASEFSAQGLANVVNAYYRAKHRNDRLMLALAPQVLKQLSQLEAQHLANLLQGFAWHLSLTRLSPGAEGTSATAAVRVSAVARTPAVAAREAGTSRGNILVKVCTALATLIPRVQQHFTSLEASACACALAAASLPESRPAVMALSDFVRQRRDSFKPEQLAVTLYSLNKQNLCPPGLLLDSAPAVLRRLQEFNDRSLVMLLHAFSRAHLEKSHASLTAALIRRLESSSILGSLPLQAVVTTLHALAAAGLRTPLFDAMLDRLLLLLQRQRVATAAASDAALLQAAATAQQHDPLLADLPVDEEAAGAGTRDGAALENTTPAEAARTEANLVVQAASAAPAAQQPQQKLENEQQTPVPVVTYVASVLISLLKLGAQDRTDVLSCCCDLVARARPKTLTAQQLTNIAFAFSKFYTFSERMHPPQAQLLSEQQSLLLSSCRPSVPSKTAPKTSAPSVGGADPLPGATPETRPVADAPPRFLPPPACLAALFAHSLLQLDTMTPQLLSSLALSFACLRELLPRDTAECWTHAFYRALPLHLERSVSPRTAANLVAACASLSIPSPPSLEVMRLLLSRTQTLLPRMSAVCFLDTLLAATALLRQFSGSAAAAAPRASLPAAGVSAHPAETAAASIQQLQQHALQQFLHSCQEQLLHRLGTTDAATLITAAHVLLAAGSPVLATAQRQPQLHASPTYFSNTPPVESSPTVFLSEREAPFLPACLSFSRLSRCMPLDLLSDWTLAWLAARATPQPAPHLGAADLLAYWRRQLATHPVDPGEKQAAHTPPRAAHPTDAPNTQTAAGYTGRGETLQCAQQPSRDNSAVCGATDTRPCGGVPAAVLAAATVDARQPTAAPAVLSERRRAAGGGLPGRETAEPATMRDLPSYAEVRGAGEPTGSSAAVQAHGGPEEALLSLRKRETAEFVEAAGAGSYSEGGVTEVVELSAVDFLLRNVKAWRVVDRTPGESAAADVGPAAVCTPTPEDQIQHQEYYVHDRSRSASDAPEGAALTPAEVIFLLLRYAAAEKRLLQIEDGQRSVGVFTQPAVAAAAAAAQAAAGARPTAASQSFPETHATAATRACVRATALVGAVRADLTGEGLAAELAPGRGEDVIMRARPAGFCGVVVNHLVAMIRRHIALFDPVLLAAVAHSAAHAGLREPQFYAAVVSRVVQSAQALQRQQQLRKLPQHPRPQQRLQRQITHSTGAEKTQSRQRNAVEPHQDGETMGQEREQRTATTTVLSVPLPAAAAVDLLEGLAVAQYSLLPGQDGETLLALLLSRNLEPISRNTGLSVRVLSALRLLDALQEPVVLHLLKRQLLLLCRTMSRKLQSIPLAPSHSQSQPPPFLQCGRPASSGAGDARSSLSQTPPAGDRSTCDGLDWPVALRYAESAAPAIVEKGPGAVTAATTGRAAASGARKAVEASLGAPGEAVATSSELCNTASSPSAVHPSGQVIPLVLPVEPLIYFLSELFSWKGVSHRLAACATGSSRTPAFAAFSMRSTAEEGSSAHAGAASVHRTQSTERSSSTKDNFFSSGSAPAVSQDSSPQHTETLKTLYLLAANYLSVVLLFLSTACKRGLLLLAAPTGFAAAVSAPPSSRGGRAAAAAAPVFDPSHLDHYTGPADGIYESRATLGAAGDTWKLGTSPGSLFVVPFSARGAAEAVQVLALLPAAAVTPLHLHAAAAAGDLALRFCTSSDVRRLLLDCSSTSAVCAVMRSLARLLLSQSPAGQEQQQGYLFCPRTAAATTTATLASGGTAPAETTHAEATRNESAGKTAGKPQHPQRKAASCMRSVLQLARTAFVPTTCDIATGRRREEQVGDISDDGKDYTRVHGAQVRKLNADVDEQNVEAKGNSGIVEEARVHLDESRKLCFEGDSGRYIEPEQQNITTANGACDSLENQLACYQKKQQRETNATEKGYTREKPGEQMCDDSTSSCSRMSAHSSTEHSTRDTRAHLDVLQGQLLTRARSPSPCADRRMRQAVAGRSDQLSQLLSMESLSEPGCFRDENSWCISFLYELLSAFDLPSFLATATRSQWEVAGNGEEVQPADCRAALSSGHNARSVDEASESSDELPQKEVHGWTRIKTLRRELHADRWEGGRHPVDAGACNSRETQQTTEEAKKRLLAVGYACLCYVERYLKEAHTLLLLSDAISVAFWCTVALSLSEAIAGAAGNESAPGRHCSAIAKGGSSSAAADSSSSQPLSNDVQESNFVFKTADNDPSHPNTARGGASLLRGAACRSGSDAGCQAHVRNMLSMALHNIASNTAAPAEKRENSGNRKAREEERVLLMIRGEDRNALMLVHSFLRLEAPDLYAGLPVRVQNILRVVAASRRGL